MYAQHTCNAMHVSYDDEYVATARACTSTTIKPENCWQIITKQIGEQGSQRKKMQMRCALVLFREHVCVCVHAETFVFVFPDFFRFFLFAIRERCWVLYNIYYFGRYVCSDPSTTNWEIVQN